MLFYGFPNGGSHRPALVVEGTFIYLEDAIFVVFEITGRYFFQDFFALVRCDPVDGFVLVFHDFDGEGILFAVNGNEDLFNVHALRVSQ